VRSLIEQIESCDTNAQLDAITKRPDFAANRAKLKPDEQRQLDIAIKAKSHGFAAEVAS
jgi:hypothetical protein